MPDPKNANCWHLALTIKIGSAFPEKPFIYEGEIQVVGEVVIHDSFPAEKREQIVRVNGIDLLLLVSWLPYGNSGNLGLPELAPPKRDDLGLFVNLQFAFATDSVISCVFFRPRPRPSSSSSNNGTGSSRTKQGHKLQGAKQR